MMEAFIIPFIAIALAEMADKSQACIFLLSSKTKKRLHVILGALAAFLIVDGIAVLLGSFATSFLPQGPVKIAAGALFIVFGAMELLKKGQSAKCDVGKRGAFFSAFSMTFLSEWGDKTQLSAAVFAAAYNPVMVLAGVLSALFILSAIAVFLGSMLSEKVDRKKISPVSAVAFIMIGISMFFF
jgi:Ca2+/H+ antiporter, TMEM165/GDT1 family